MSKKKNSGDKEKVREKEKTPDRGAVQPDAHLEAIYNASWLSSNEQLVLKPSEEYAKKRAKILEQDKKFLKAFIKDYGIESEKDLSTLLGFWRNVTRIGDYNFEVEDKADDLLEIAQHLHDIIEIFETGPSTNSSRLGGAAPDMILKLEEYKEICLKKHRPAVNHAPAAHQMDFFVEQAADYIINGLRIPFSVYESYSKKKNPTMEILERISKHLNLTRENIDTRGLAAAAARYKKNLSQKTKKHKPKNKE